MLSRYLALRCLILLTLSGLFHIVLLKSARADVVKPALIEITASTSARVTVEIRASIEALLTGINAQYKNTKQAPNADAYDALRILSSEALDAKFRPFIPELLKSVLLSADGAPVELKLASVKIPDPGYTKVPRISVLVLTGSLKREVKSLKFYYPAKFGDSAIRVRQVDEAREKWHWSEWQWIRKDEASKAFALDNLFHRRPVYNTVAEYIAIGFSHILPKGLDHVLFVLGLFLFNTKMRPLLWQVTMFTIAHTLTLGMSMAGIIDLPARIVEPLIALSIAYIGFENVYTSQLRPHRLALVFGFGLLHGLGFASVLADFGMPENAFMTALISFNIGVELGQLAVIAIAFLAVGLWFGSKPGYRNAVIIPGSLVIAAIGLYWTVERLDLV